MMTLRLAAYMLALAAIAITVPLTTAAGEQGIVVAVPRRDPGRDTLRGGQGGRSVRERISVIASELIRPVAMPLRLRTESWLETDT